jgi:hypothetical protein
VDLLRISDAYQMELAAQGVSKKMILGIEFIATCLRQACEMVAEDCGEDRFDDAIGEGGLRWRRTRKLAMIRHREGAVPGLASATLDSSDGALQLVVEDCSLSFYSARDGIDSPSILGSTRKGQVVSEMQLQLNLGTAQAPSRLVLLYEADENGLRISCVGMLAMATRWAWQIPVFNRDDMGLASNTEEDQTRSAEASPAYREQPEPKLPDLPAREGDESVKEGRSDAASN